ncbi:MAG: SCO family protein [Legionellaceae bacterium]|nr:SCO family protein [Legionellaceae bacterium]
MSNSCSSPCGVRWTVIILIAFGAMMAGFFVNQHWHPRFNPQDLYGTFLDKPRALPSFQAEGTNTKVFSSEQLKNHWTFLFFGFTNCPDVCPTTMHDLTKMMTILEQKHSDPLPQVVLFSIDPNRDSIARLREYTHAFHTSFIGVRSNKNTLNLLTKTLGVAFNTVHLKNNQYTLQHTQAVMLINPKGELVAFFTNPHQPEAMAKDYQSIISHYSSI